MFSVIRSELRCMTWDQALVVFRMYLKLERSLSDRTVEAYVRDVKKLKEYALSAQPALLPAAIGLEDLQIFIGQQARAGLEASSQARLISALRSFYRSLRLERIVEVDPTELLESPRQGRKLPIFLTVQEVEEMIAAVDLSLPLAHRDLAIIETLYSCGLRVSECCGLRISRLHFGEGFLRVVGKGDKERLVPIGPEAIRRIEQYRQGERVHLPVQKKSEDSVFLNARGGTLSRVSVFNLVKKLAIKGYRKCWAMPASPPPRSIRTWTGNICAATSCSSTRGRGKRSALERINPRAPRAGHRSTYPVQDPCPLDDRAHR